MKIEYCKSPEKRGVWLKIGGEREPEKGLLAGEV